MPEPEQGTGLASLRDSAPVAILVNGPSSSGKTTLCRALQDRLSDGVATQANAPYARVAFDDVVSLMSDRLHPICFVEQQGGDLSRLISRERNDGRAGWDYRHDDQIARPDGAQPDGNPRLRLVLNPHGRTLLAGVHRSWGQHLALGTNLIIDHFLQEREWQQEVLEIIQRSGARLLCVGVFCAVAELERRESTRGDGCLEERPLGLARRSSELCHSHQLKYHVTVHTDRQCTADSVKAVLAALEA